jgi:thioesterase domain-containing protein
VALLALFDTYGPGYLTMSRRVRLAWHWKAWTHLEAAERVRYLSDRARARWQRLTSPPDGELCQPDAEEVVAGVEDEWQFDVLRRALSPAERAEMLAFKRQARRSPGKWRYDGRLLLFTAEDKPREFLSMDPLLGWGDFASNIENCPVPGNHTGIVRKPHVRVLAGHLQNALRQARVNQAT